MTSSLSYRDAGVNIDNGNRLIEHIKPLASRTHRAGVLAGLGGFGALFELPVDRYQQPVLVSATDGVGTKLRLAMQMKQHQTIGIDLVAMCVNDLIVQGAEPLFFLDYYATGQLNVAEATLVVDGIATGCELAGAALVGGETAEMPDMYQHGDYDLAGFCVGVVEKSKIINGANIEAGDVLLGLASSGAHSNGYSLIRKILAVTQAELDSDFHGQSLGQTLLTPTRIYVKSLLNLFAQVTVKGVAHITGGGLPENLPRILPAHIKAQIDDTSWQWPPIFTWLQQQGRVETAEMLRTFNCGVGMVLCVAPQDVEQTMAILTATGETVWRLGECVSA